MGRSGESDLVEVPVDRVWQRDTEQAYAVQYGLGDRLMWLPKSLVEIDEGESTATMPEWLAIYKGLPIPAPPRKGLCDTMETGSNYLRRHLQRLAEADAASKRAERLAVATACLQALMTEAGITIIQQAHHGLVHPSNSAHQNNLVVTAVAYADALLEELDRNSSDAA